MNTSPLSNSECRECKILPMCIGGCKQKLMENEHHSVTDEQLCALAAAGDRSAEEALVLRYTRLVRMCARPFFLAGGDSEDLIQEGMLGLLAAIREFRPDRIILKGKLMEVCRDCEWIGVCARDLP